MFTQTVVNVAILAYYLAMPGLLSHSRVHAVQKDIGGQVLPGPSSDGDMRYFLPTLRNFPLADQKLAEKVVIREGTLSEKLGVETVIQPDTEIVALQSSVSGLKSVFAWGEQLTTQTPGKLPRATEWKGKRVVCLWDEDGGFYSDGTYFPMSINPISSIGLSSLGEPFKCVLFVPTERGNEARRIVFKPDSFGRTPNDFFDYPDSNVSNR
jgi:hypothetical protein